MTEQSGGTYHGIEAEYERAVWSGSNESGYEPFSINIIVLPDVVQTKTSGGIQLIDEFVDRANLGSETGVIVAVSPNAYRRFSNGEIWQGEKPKVGDRVVFEKYAGRLFRGTDGKFYRIMDDSCVGALEQTSEKAKGGNKKTKG